MNDQGISNGASAPIRNPRVFVIFPIIWCGLLVTELITSYLLGLTLKQFTVNIGIIGTILASKPFFGFVAQPIVGVLSDRMWTPLGRRAIFLILGAPLVAVCLFYVPLARQLWQVAVLVILWQLFQDISWGSDHPLMADLVPAHQRTIVMGIITTSSQIVSWAFLRYGMGPFQHHFGDAGLYRLAAVVQVLFVSGAALFLNEKPIPRKARPKLTVMRYVRDMLGDPILRKFALVAFTGAVCAQVILDMASLFAIYTLHLSKAAFGAAWSWQSILSFGFALPLSILIEKALPRQWALVGGFALFIVAGIMGLLTHSAFGLLLTGLVFGFGQMINIVTQKPFFTLYLPRDLIGQLSGAYNVCFALGRSLATLGTGWVIQLMGGEDFRIIWMVSIVFAVASMAVAMTIPDERYDEKRRTKAGAGG